MFKDGTDYSGEDQKTYVNPLKMILKSLKCRENLFIFYAAQYFVSDQGWAGPSPLFGKYREKFSFFF